MLKFRVLKYFREYISELEMQGHDSKCVHLVKI